MDKDIDYIKKMFCRYNCNAMKGACELDLNYYINDESELCDMCQIDNFIRELQNNKII